MKTKTLSTISATTLLAALVFCIGCDEKDARLERVVDQSLQQQAAQSHDNAQLHQHVSEGTKNLVEADAKARQDLLALQHELRADQATVGQQRDLLEQERKQVASDRHWDQLLAVALADFGLVLACIAPLVLAGYAIFVAARAPADEGIGEILIQEIVASNPLLLPAPALPGLRSSQPLGDASAELPPSLES